MFVSDDGLSYEKTPYGSHRRLVVMARGEWRCQKCRQIKKVRNPAKWFR
jgi:hypothetical protein